jgi:hypothetical protein
VYPNEETRYQPFAYEFCCALQLGPRQGGPGRLFVGCKLTPGVKSQPINLLTNDKDGGGRILFVLAYGLVASYSQQLCSN